MKYVPIAWPAIQNYQEKDGFENHSVLIDDIEGYEDFGPGAYFVETNWLNEDIDDEDTYTTVGWPECQMLEELPEFEDHSYPDDCGGYFVETDWLKLLTYSPT